MDDVYSARVDSIALTWRVWAELGDGLTDGQWSTASRCTGWDVAALYAHHSAFPRYLSAPLPQEDQSGVPVTADDILRGFNAPDGVAHTMAATVADRAVAQAAQHSRQELVEGFAVQAPRAVDQLRRTRATLVVPWVASGAVLMLVEALRIVVLEATVHLLDVQRALRIAPAVPPAALTDTARLLAEIAPAVEFVEAATGRSTDSPLPVLR